MVENVLILVTVNVRLALVATTVNFGQICIVFLLLYLGLRLCTSVRYVLCFSSGILPWATTVDFGQVCIVFLFRYCILDYDC